jgi:ADP-dependent NAD(P)H-hydrate dehydratase
MPPEVVTALPVLPRRPADSHKGMFGHVLVVAGSRGMSGAAILTASAALRGGAGLVTLATPEPAQPPAAAANPCYMTLPLPADEYGQVAATAEPLLFPAAAKSTVLACGPGLGQGSGVTRVVIDLLSRVNKPCVLDADGLNAVARALESLRRRDPLVITPHPGEFARLLGKSAAVVQADREGEAVQFAGLRGVVLVLKGHQTLVTDGKRLYRNTTGNPGMATGGTGDVLTGLIAALIAQKLDAFAAAQLGVYLHGLAGDLARDVVGEVSLTATDLLALLPRAFQSVVPR